MVEDRMEMDEIQLLDQQTVDKIAAGEVVERPASVVKELVENAIDAKASAITVEIKDGGITMIRVTDNGRGIPHEQIPIAFLRHSTSKIRNVADLDGIRSLGFRGEALSSIAAVSRTELITKTKEELTGSNYRIEGGKEIELREIGAPEGTTFFVRQLFYNVPARKKFLKSPMTEGNYVIELVEKLSISHPHIAFRLLVNGAEKLITSGNGNLKDVIYQIYGRDITSELLEIRQETPHFFVHGFIGTPEVNRGNRSYESMFVDGRYVKSNTLLRALEYAYESFMMQHRYPFAVLNLDFEGHEVDVNVHPTKQEVRFFNNDEIQRDLSEIIRDRLLHREDIQTVTAPQPQGVEEEKPPVMEEKFVTPLVVAEPFEEKHLDSMKESIRLRMEEDLEEVTPIAPEPQIVKPAPKYEQQRFFSEESIKTHRIIGQVFDTYWMVEFDNCLYIIDQHAAHEKVLFERTMKRLKDMEMTSQQISPPMVVSLSESDRALLFENADAFQKVGYEFSSFGGSEVMISAIPDNLFGIDAKDLFLNTLAGISEIGRQKDPDLILEKVASMSCKAAVKGHDHLSMPEIETLIRDLLSLDNPYHCPHGRPTIIRMTQYELDKKFKRIV